MTQSAPAGWYPDQTGIHRWWDGYQWTAAATSTKSVGISYLLLALLGGFAGHRFYLRRYASAVIFNLVWWTGWATTILGFGFILVGIGALWLIIDLFLIPNMARTTPA